MRYRNVNTKVVVDVRDGHPITTDSDWEPDEAPKSRTKKNEPKGS